MSQISKDTFNVQWACQLYVVVAILTSMYGWAAVSSISAVSRNQLNTLRSCIIDQINTQRQSHKQNINRLRIQHEGPLESGYPRHHRQCALHRYCLGP